MLLLLLTNSTNIKLFSCNNNSISNLVHLFICPSENAMLIIFHLSIIFLERKHPSLKDTNSLESIITL